MDGGIQALLDERAIAQVMLQYARGIDDRNWEQVRACFTFDAMITGTGHAGPRDEYLEQLFAGVGRYAVTMHTIGNQVVELDGDTARTETDLVARHFADAEGRAEVLVIAVRYRDLLRRDGQRWTITRRDVQRLWSRP